MDRSIGVITTILLLTSTAAILMSAAPIAGAQDDDTVKVAMFALEGTPYGAWTKNGWKTGLEYAADSGTYEDSEWTAGDRTIETKTYSTYKAPSEIVSDARSAIDDWGADILVGAVLSSTGKKLASVAESRQTPYWLCPAAASSLTEKPTFSKYVFRAGRNSWHDAITAAYIQQEYQPEAETIAFMGEDYIFGQDGIDAAKSAFEDVGLDTVAIEYPPKDTTEFGPYLDRIQNADPDLVFVAWAGATEYKSMYDAMNERGMLEKLVPAVIDYYSMNYLNVATDGLYEGRTGFAYFGHGVTTNEVYEAQLSLYEDYDITPDASLAPTIPDNDVASALGSSNAPELFGGVGFATAQFVVEGVRQAPSIAPDSLIATWEGMTLQTAYGETTIRPEDHQAMRPMFVAETQVDTDSESTMYNALHGYTQETLSKEYVENHIPVNTDYEPISGLDVSIDASTDSGVAPVDVDFDASVSGGVSPYSYEWSLGNGETATGSSAEVTYENANTDGYDVTLEVTDNAGTTGSASATVKVYESAEQQEEEEGGGMSTTVIAAAVVVVVVVVVAAVFLMRSQ
uniref:ABC branched-chain amino acid transporter substrate-binding protein n=1 Tax=uncultured organism TaxID=155900 RepID=M1PPQ2_9ZZZZ|nr:ABC branched-chain amino acid transporter substrate-binding protein [uncultured organism]